MTTGSGYFQIGDMLICYGQITVGGSGSTSSAMKRITFPKAFSGVPMVVATPVTSAALTLVVHVATISATQAEFYSVGNDNVWYTAGVITNYIAIGKA